MGRISQKVYEIKAEDITMLVRSLLLKANIDAPAGMRTLIEESYKKEQMPLAKQALKDILKNIRFAAEKKLPICQDCGLAVVFIEIGQDVHIVGGYLIEAVNKGVKQAYIDGYLRKSVDKDPVFNRQNTCDNTPAVIHCEIVPGDSVKIIVSPKGMGSENMSRLYMLRPADGTEGIINAVVDTVRLAGANPCPPIVLGIGIGGNFEAVALAAKRALLKKEGVRNTIPQYAEMEREIIKRVNELGIGAGGYGGIITALDVHIEALPTHIAGMPVAVNICCHALRHAEGVIKGEEKIYD